MILTNKRQSPQVRENINQYEMILVITSDLEVREMRKTKTSNLEDEENKYE